MSADGSLDAAGTGTEAGAAAAGGAGRSPRSDAERDGGRAPETGPVEPCLRCGMPLPLRQMGCKGGHCPNCSHPYPHGDCSD